jgi:hypothetical protein
MFLCILWWVVAFLEEMRYDKPETRLASRLFGQATKEPGHKFGALSQITHEDISFG